MYDKQVLFFFLLGVLSLGNCGNNHQAQKGEGAGDIILTIATAANVQFAIKEIEKVYEATTGRKLTIIIGSSGKLTAQIKQGAPYDLLISANMKYPESLYKDGLATSAPAVYALGGLVLWTMKKGIVMDESLAFLTQDNIRKIAIANPKNAPYGEQAINAFQYFGIQEAIMPKLVYAENIAQTNQYIITKNCEVGITAKSVVIAPEIKGEGQWKDISPSAYQPINQGVIITKYGAQKHGVAAKQFYDFLFSSTANEILEKYGYIIPEDERTRRRKDKTR